MWESLILTLGKGFLAICHAAGWLLLAAIIAVTISPITERPAMGVAPRHERAAAFFALGLLFGLEYRLR